MSVPKSKIGAILLAVVWLAVVAAAVFIAVTRREGYGSLAYIAPGMAAAMLVIFALTYLPRRLKDSPWAEGLGELAVAVLILFAIAILAMAILSTNNGIVGTAALVLFLLAFIRIFRDYMKHLKRSRAKRPRTNRQAGGDGEGPAADSDARPD